MLPRLGPILLVTIIAFCSRGDRWTVVPATSAFSIHHQEPTISATVSIRRTGGRTALLAVNKPKRRKRKTSSNDDNVDDDSLPDFDIADDSSTTASSTVSSSSPSSSSSTAASRSKPTNTDVISFNEITPEMMGSSYVKDTTVGDLIRDRSLESKFVFDDDEDDADLPDLPMFPNTASSSSEPLENKKKVRKAASIAAAAAAQKKREEEEEGNLVRKIPFALDEKGEVSALKILENGTWLGIGLLVGWELYINSPFFERAQPMIPVVYDIVWFT
jgi:hypothetical protein